MNEQPTPDQPKRPRGGQKGNQNGRVHGRYSRLNSADRHAALQRVLNAYGLKESSGEYEGVIVRALEDPNTPRELVTAFLELYATFTESQVRIRPTRERQSREAPGTDRDE